MTSQLRVCLILTLALLVSACAGSMVQLIDVDGEQFTFKSLPKDQVKEAIMDGAQHAGWSTKDMGQDVILATYHIRVHSVQVRIDFTNYQYSTRYSTSNAMKMFCSERDKESNRLTVSGQRECLGNGVPTYIHANYKKWSDALSVSIQRELTAK